MEKYVAWIPPHTCIQMSKTILQRSSTNMLSLVENVQRCGDMSRTDIFYPAFEDDLLPGNFR